MWFLIKLWDAYWNVKQNVSSAELLLTYRENPYKYSIDCIFNRLTNYLLIDYVCLLVGNNNSKYFFNFRLSLGYALFRLHWTNSFTRWKIEALDIIV